MSHIQAENAIQLSRGGRHRTGHNLTRVVYLGGDDVRSETENSEKNARVRRILPPRIPQELRRLHQMPRLGFLVVLCLILSTERVKIAHGDSCIPNCGLIGNMVWRDANGDGIYNQGLELGVPGVSVELYEATEDGQIVNAVPIRQAITDSFGNYQIEAPMFSWYILKFLPPPPSSVSAFGLTQRDAGMSDYTDSDPDTVSELTHQFYLGQSQDESARWDAGILSGSCIEVGDMVFKDVEVDGEYTPLVDDLVAGATVRLKQKFAFPVLGSIQVAYSLVEETQTNANGIYSFPCVNPFKVYVITLADVDKPASPFYDVNVENGDDLDNNCFYQNGLASDEACMTAEFQLGQDHPSPDHTIDLAVACNIDAIDAVLVLDTSGSMKNYFETVLNAGKELVDVVLANPSSMMALVTYSSSAELKVPLTASAGQLKAALDIKHLTASGSTNIAEGISTGAAALPGPVPGRERFIILLSDGVPTTGPSGKTAKQAAIDEATAAKLAGIKIATVGLGSVAPGTLSLLASGSDYDFETDIPHEVGRQFRAAVAALCTGMSSQLPCTGEEILEWDLGTGVDVYDGWDQNWNVLMTSAPPPPADAAVVTSPPADWVALPGSAWIGNDAEGASAGPSGSRYSYAYYINPPPGHVVTAMNLDFRAQADDEITSVQFAGVPLRDAHGGEFDKNPLHIRRQQPVYLNVPYPSLRISVRDTDVGTTGLNVAGTLRACSSAGVAPGWNPKDTADLACTWGNWGKQHEAMTCVEGDPSDCRTARPIKQEHNGAEAFCISWGVACCQQSAAIPVDSTQACITTLTETNCCAFEEGPCTGCASGRQYQFPSPGNPFDLGPRTLAAVDEDPTYTGMPHFTTNPPGSFVLIPDDSNHYPIAERWKNADHSSFNFPDRMERYVSTCTRGGELGCVIPIQGNGMPNGGALQWTIWEPYTVEPRECLLP